MTTSRRTRHTTPQVEALENIISLSGVPSLVAGAGPAPAHVGPVLAPAAQPVSSALKPALSLHEGLVGGSGGSRFDDGGPETVNGRITDVLIHSGQYIDSIQVSEGNPAVLHPRHGGNGGYPNNLILAGDEYITEVSGKYGKFIDSLTIQTNKGQIGHWGGDGGKYDFDFAAPPGYAIVGFYGRSGQFLDAIGVIVAPAPSTTA